MDNFNLQRFLIAQEHKYIQALKEIQNGEKYGHWIWYIFPQLKGLGHSHRSRYYGIISEEEAKAYMEHPLLGERLREITKALLQHAQSRTAREILGYIDTVKVQSCMTLFYLISGESLFKEVLNKFYNGKMCEYTCFVLMP